ncbi:LON peptidase substrate-binding domain-containing protein [Bdellovibrio reynosensis]|uniref:LON peptidase substrate-binding domain-containing protein n=1 Tax=Bdellovibrio reynosensis TaxID=2835041 RepID=A0ABY4CE44_9BACT|nr:LON peptidase substrate-binding domain-containing protein [Bdellovibrio reynosensis]UOF01813.1 LON peptidase substrate-binding domain-containing protein [Bdellovibrio reynosensis]
MEVFLFPLVNVTLFPRTTKPLNVFEPRYLAMVREAVRSQTPIALGFIEDPSKVTAVQPGEKVSFVREIAGFGQAQIIEERVNGTLLVFLKGEGKLRLGKVLDKGRPYIVCEAEIIPEENELLPQLQTELDALFRSLYRWIETHIPDPTQRDILLRNLVEPEEIVGSFASYLVRDYDMQHMVLEFKDINEKVRFLYRLLESGELTT